MKTIIGTDFSGKAMEAGSAAAAMARAWGDILVLAHADPEMNDMRMPREVRETRAACQNACLHDEANRLRHLGAMVEEHMLSSAPDVALTELAGGAEIRMVIVSSLGSRPGEWLLGSVAERTAEHSPVPTLVVRSSQALLEWTKGKRTLKIFIAFDFTNVAEQALHWVRNLQAIGPCEVVIGYISSPFREEHQMGLSWHPCQTHNPARVQEILEREILTWAAQVLTETRVRVRCEPSLGRPDGRLIEVACEEKADLVVTGTHQRTKVQRIWHPSISTALLRHAPMSVLCVPGDHSQPEPSPMMAVHRVLAAVDLSTHGRRAISLAYGIIRAGGVVHIIHVVPPFTGLSHTEKAREEIETLVPRYAAARGIETEVEIVESSDVAKSIVQAGERFGAQVICVGAHNRSGLNKVLVGSVAKEVMAQSNRPVLVVRDMPP